MRGNMQMIVKRCVFKWSGLEVCVCLDQGPPGTLEPWTHSYRLWRFQSQLYGRYSKYSNFSKEWLP